MLTLATSILVCLAIAGQVVSSVHRKDDFSKVETQTMETALIMRLLHNDMAHIQGVFLNRFTISSCQCTIIILYEVFR